MTRLAIGVGLALGALGTAGASGAAADDNGALLRPGAVFAMSNSPSGNEVVAFGRNADGTLTQAPVGRYPTGGTGSGTVENSANGLILGEQSPNNLNGGYRLLFATNTGSNSLTVFRVKPNGLEQADVESRGIDHPISVTVHDHTVYVLNGGRTNCMGGTPTITGFTVTAGGQLTPIPGSTRPVSGGLASGCAQVSFNPSGTVLAVTQRVRNAIDTFAVGKDGVAQGPIVNENSQAGSVGPFGITFTQRDQLLATQNFGAAPTLGGLASYDVGRDGTLRIISPRVPNTRSDTCWVVNTDDGKFAFVSNAGSGDVSSYRVQPDGTLTLLNPTAGNAGGGIAGGLDEALSGDSHYFYVRNLFQGTITGFRVENDGALTRLQDVVDPADLQPGGAIGLAAK